MPVPPEMVRGPEHTGSRPHVPVDMKPIKGEGVPKRTMSEEQWVAHVRGLVYLASVNNEKNAWTGK
ncbi:MAG TPA: hypothetical protein VF209_02930 [Patescibacteria group bacterium]